MTRFGVYFSMSLHGVEVATVESGHQTQLPDQDRQFVVVNRRLRAPNFSRVPDVLKTHSHLALHASISLFVSFSLFGIDD